VRTKTRERTKTKGNNEGKHLELSGFGVDAKGVLGGQLLQGVAARAHARQLHMLGRLHTAYQIQYHIHLPLLFPNPIRSASQTLSDLHSEPHQVRIPNPIRSAFQTPWPAPHVGPPPHSLSHPVPRPPPLLFPNPIRSASQTLCPAPHVGPPGAQAHGTSQTA
jgi:hypothetical protein